MTSVDGAGPLEQLTGEGGPFEIVVEDVVGHPTQVYKQRMHSLRELMAQNAVRADVDWLVQEDGAYTFGEHDRLARVLAQSLADLGVERGDRVALVSANVPEWVITFWACRDSRRDARAAQRVVEGRRARVRACTTPRRKVLIGDARRLAIVRDRLENVPSLEHVFEFGSPEWRCAPRRPTTPVSPSRRSTKTTCSRSCYTSGTTGQPKGATLTHRQAIANLQNIIVLGVAPAMRGTRRPKPRRSCRSASLLVVPLFHVTGCLSTMTLDVRNRRKARAHAGRSFRPRHRDAASSNASRSRRSAVCRRSCGAFSNRRTSSKYDLSSVQRASYGGAPAAPELVERIEKVFPHMRKTLTTAYGLTETASVATAHGGDDYFAHPGSVGRAAPTVELRVVDDSGVDQPPGERGEIWIKGPTVMTHGYWRRPDANEASFSDGWFHTGDIGYLDADGFFFLVDRAKDMIIRAGENVYCVEIENVLFDHPDVIDAAVVGVPHKTLGEEVKAVVQLRDGARRRRPRSCASSVAEHLANFKVPEYVEFRTEPLPRNPAGKVLKNLLRGGDSAFAASDDQARRSAVRHPSRLGLHRDRRELPRGLVHARAWRWKRLRTRFLWWPTIIAESMMMIQVLLGVLLVSVQHYKPPRFHMFYGFVAFITVGLALLVQVRVASTGLDGARVRLRGPVHHGPRHSRRSAGRLTLRFSHGGHAAAPRHVVVRWPVGRTRRFARYRRRGCACARPGQVRGHSRRHHDRGSMAARRRRPRDARVGARRVAGRVRSGGRCASGSESWQP